jgi:hypothetical protein
MLGAGCIALVLEFPPHEAVDKIVLSYNIPYRLNCNSNLSKKGMTMPPHTIPAGRLFAGKPAVNLTPEHRERHDGWTGDRQRKFLAVLAHKGCVTDACRIVGVSTTSAYRLRRLHRDFASAWDKALHRACQGLEAIAYKRAVEGTETIIIRNGVEVERRIAPSDGLLALLIKRGRLNHAAFLHEDDVITRDEHMQGWRFHDQTGDKHQLHPMFHNGADPKAELIAKITQMRERKQAHEAREREAAEKAGLNQPPE